MNNLLLIIILLLCLTAVFIGFMTAKIFEPRHYHVTIPRMKMANTNVAQLGEPVWSLSKTFFNEQEVDGLCEVVIHKM